MFEKVMLHSAEFKLRLSVKGNFLVFLGTSPSGNEILKKKFFLL
jgi:hypothetical protein